MSPLAPTQEGLRLELKFATDAAVRHEIELWLRTCALAFRQVHPPRLVNSLYFDSLDADALAAKLAGVSVREKVRYRWYGDARAPAPGQLEVKRRANGLGWKDTYRVATPPAASTRVGFVRALRAAVPPPARAWLDAYPEPMLINRYRRAYFACARGEVRATVDHQIQVWDQRLGAFPQMTRAAAMPALVVLELKLPPDLRARVAAALADLRHVQSAVSKYELGLRAIS